MRKTTSPVTVDFETFKIQDRPDYPPAPVGVSIKYKGAPARYYAWGHPVGNNCTFKQALSALQKAWKWKGGLLFQNAKFDLDVAEVHCALPIPPWTQVHDTMFLLFLDDPHQPDLGLKSAAERLLGMPPEERDAVADWLIDNQPVGGVTISSAKSSDHYFGGYIAHAPGDLVASYANGDVERTERLYELLLDKTLARGMGEAYDRERRLLPILLDMDRRGVPVDLPLLRSDVKMYSDVLARLDTWIKNRLGLCKDSLINLDSSAELLDAMLSAGVVDTDLMPLTKTGKISTAKESLHVGVTDAQLYGVLQYRAQLNTCMRTFMMPWLAVAERAGGLIYTYWNQVRSPKKDKSAGARTGRLSSNPNFQNIPKTFKPIFKVDTPDRALKRKLPAPPFKDLPPLPRVRHYIKAPKGYVLIRRDYSAQELRMLAHFEDGDMLQAYINDPDVDFHETAKNEIKKLTGIETDRSKTKIIAFSIIYGSGLGLLAQGLGVSVAEAQQLKNAYLRIFPGILDVQKVLKNRARRGEPFRTMGGREYYCEKPKIINGKFRSFDYKQLNYLVQGSSAEQTKDAVIEYDQIKVHGKLILLVHDEMIAMVPEKHYKKEMAILKQAMHKSKIDTPIRSSGSYGVRWTEMKEMG